MTTERSLVLIKHDAVSRGLIGDIISRIEKTGLKVIGMKMLVPQKNIAMRHYKITEDWAKSVFEKAKKVSEATKKEFKFKDPLAYGEMIHEMNVSYLSEGAVVALVCEGPHALEIIRKLVGHTEPRQALTGTIRGDYSYDSYTIADLQKRSIKNLIHASENSPEAQREISLWFNDNELV